MKRIMIIILVLVSMLIWLNNVEAYTIKSVYPENFGVGLPITTQIAVVLDVPISMAGVSFSISPNVPGFPSVAGSVSAEECEVLSYKYTPLLNYKLNKCFRIVFTPANTLDPGVLYTAEIRDGEFGPPFVWSFKVGTMSVSPEQVIETEIASYTRPDTGICSLGAVLVWQKKGVGILAQLFDSEKQPFGDVIKIAGPEFYSPNIGPDVAMDNNCDWIVGYQNDIALTKDTTIIYIAKRYDFDGNMLPSPQPILHTIQPGVAAHLDDFYKTQKFIGGIRVATSPSGKYFAVVYPAQYCFEQCGGSDSYWYGGKGSVCKVAQYRCDNYMMGNIYDSNNVPTVLGDNKRTKAGGNILAPFAIKIINDIPFFDKDYNTLDLGGGCGSDCAYYPDLCMSESVLGVTWTEYKGTNGGYPQLAKFDDIEMWAYDIQTGKSTNEIRVNMLQGARYDHWLSSCAASDSGYLTVFFNARYLTNVPGKERAQREMDVYARIMDPDHKWLTKTEFLVNDPSNTASEQHAASVSMDDATKKIRFFWLGNGPLGPGVYTKQFDYAGLALTSEGRLTPPNHIRLNMEMEKKPTTADMARACRRKATLIKN
jgi:hypothetical protein